MAERNKNLVNESATRKVRAADASGRFSYDGLDRVMHEKARLGILTSLVAHPSGIAFNDLKELCSLTDGNLSRHLEVLSEAGLVEVYKESGRGRPQTTYQLTKDGRRRFLDYLSVLESVIADAARVRAGAQRTSRRPGLAT
jgi:predicted ArsR family transcriptional regulator